MPAAAVLQRAGLRCFGISPMNQRLSLRLLFTARRCVCGECSVPLPPRAVPSACRAASGRYEGSGPTVTFEGSDGYRRNAVSARHVGLGLGTSRGRSRSTCSRWAGHRRPARVRCRQEIVDSDEVKPSQLICRRRSGARGRRADASAVGDHYRAPASTGSALPDARPRSSS